MFVNGPCPRFGSRIVFSDASPGGQKRRIRASEVGNPRLHIEVVGSVSTEVLLQNFRVSARTTPGKARSISPMPFWAINH